MLYTRLAITGEYRLTVMNIRTLQEAIDKTRFTKSGVQGVSKVRSVSNAQRQSDGEGDDAYDPFQYGTSVWDIQGLPPGALTQVYQQLALWLAQNLDHPLASTLKLMYGFDDESLEEYLTSDNPDNIRMLINLITRVVTYWGDPDFGPLDPDDPDSGPFLPDFPFRGPLTTGNIGSGPGFGGVFKSIKTALNDFLQDLYDDSVEDVSGHMNAWLIQMIQIILEQIDETENP